MSVSFGSNCPLIEKTDGDVTVKSAASAAGRPANMDSTIIHFLACLTSSIASPDAFMEFRLLGFVLVLAVVNHMHCSGASMPVHRVAVWDSRLSHGLFPMFHLPHADPNVPNAAAVAECHQAPVPRPNPWLNCTLAAMR